MSSIKLKKDHDGKKAGEVISVPFLKAQELRKAGVGEFWNDGKGEKKKAEPEAEEPKAEAPKSPPAAKAEPKPATRSSAPAAAPAG